MMISSALLVVLAAGARAQVVVPADAAQTLESAMAEIKPVDAPGADELIARLRDGERSERLSAAATIGARMVGFDSNDQALLVTALHMAADSMQTPPEVRAKSYLVLGESVAWLKGDSARREAIETLLTVISDTGYPDERQGYRRHALKGLAVAAQRLPSDNILEQRVGLALVAAAAATGVDTVERGLALRGLDSLLMARPSLVYQRRGELAQRLESQVLDTFLRDPQIFCQDSRWDAESRYFAVKLARVYAWASADSSARLRVKTSLTTMGEVEPSAQLRQLARLYARGIPS